jgi:hypothetical protein
VDALILSKRRYQQCEIQRILEGWSSALVSISYDKMLFNLGSRLAALVSNSMMQNAGMFHTPVVSTMKQSSIKQNAVKIGDAGRQH